MKVFIAGAGELGAVLAQQLVAAGDTVYALRRTPQLAQPGIQAICGALAQPDSYSAALGTCAAVVFCAAPEARTELAYRTVYQHGLASLLAHCAERPVLLCTSTAVYAQDDGSWVDEQSACLPVLFNGQILLNAEQMLRPQDTALRLSGIYGRNHSHLLSSVRAGTPVQSAPPLWSNRIHLQDAAGAIAHLLRMADREQIYNLSDDQPAPQHQVHAWLADKLGLPPAPAKSGISAGKRVSNRRLRASGFSLRYPSFTHGYGQASVL